MYGIGAPELVMIAIIGLVFVLPYWKIFSKAGFPGWLSLMMIVPIVNFVCLFYVAFAEWPIQRELHSMKKGLNGTF